jgi:hypothetical protein
VQVETQPAFSGLFDSRTIAQTVPKPGSFARIWAPAGFATETRRVGSFTFTSQNSCVVSHINTRHAVTPETTHSPTLPGAAEFAGSIIMPNLPTWSHVGVAPIIATGNRRNSAG